MYEGFQPVSFSVKKTCYPCHLPPWEMVFIPAAFRMSPCFTVPVSWASPWLELICDSVRRQVLPPALFSPLLLAGASDDKLLRGRERKECSKDDLWLLFLLVHLCLGEIFALGYVLFPLWVMSLPFSLHSPPLPFPIMAKRSLQLAKELSQTTNTSKCRRIGVCPIFG